MILGIDACNIRSGGGLEHLNQILKNCDFDNLNISRIVIWSNKETLASLPSHEKIFKRTNILLNSNFFLPFFFQFFYLRKNLILEGCDLLLVPGGIYIGCFKPFVSISQNMLPFNLKEAFRYKAFSIKVRFVLIRFLQSYTFRKSIGVIFLSKYAQNTISNLLNLKVNSIVIPHGFKQLSIYKVKDFYKSQKLKLLYVSPISPYKHQWNVVEAVCLLFMEGINVKLTLVGPLESDSYNKVLNVMKKYSCSNDCIELAGYIPHNRINEFYVNADAFVFASTCENNPIILVEAISAGLPILSSFYPPMNELLDNEETFFFDPLNVQSIKDVIYNLYQDFSNICLRSKNLRNKKFNLPNWQVTSSITYQYLHDCLNLYKNEKR